jgi:citrate synthase
MASQRYLPPAAVAVLREAAARHMPLMDGLRMGVDTIGLCTGEPHPAGAVDVGCAVAIVAHMGTLAAAYSRLLKNQTPIDPRSWATPETTTCSPPEPHPSRPLETYLNTVVDHGMNASTFTARVITSTRSDIVSAIVGAIGALKGPLHGGAPGPALDMVFEIRERAAKSGKSVAQEAEAWAHETVSAGGRIMGFGHRVYKVRTRGPMCWAKLRTTCRRDRRGQLTTPAWSRTSCCACSRN